MPQFRAAADAPTYHEHARLQRRRQLRQSGTAEAQSEDNDSREEDNEGKQEEEAQQEEANCELILQHRAIHAGMDQLEKYLRDCRSPGKRETLDLAVLKEKMDSWGEVLMKHLDQEVEELGAENMRRFWTREEMRGFEF